MTKNSEPSHHRGRQRDVLGYLFNQPAGKHVTVAELEKHFKGKYDHHQIMATMANVVTGRSQLRYGIPIERVTIGVWKVKEGVTGNNVQPPLPLENGKVEVSGQHVSVPSQGFRQEMVVEVLKERDTYLLVEDLVDGKIYKMTLVG